jgi:hypothetical protein
VKERKRCVIDEKNFLTTKDEGWQKRRERERDEKGQE